MYRAASDHLLRLLHLSLSLCVPLRLKDEKNITTDSNVKVNIRRRLDALSTFCMNPLNRSRVPRAEDRCVWSGWPGCVYTVSA